MVIVQAERVVLRHGRLFDHEPMYRIFGDADVMRFGDGEQTKEWVQHWLATCLKQFYRGLPSAP